VFRVEARPLDGANLPIGLPVTVTPAEPEPRS
jgi:HlyD family secretion protein